MRDLLTYIGIALILALSAAVAAPLFIDFDAFRPRIAEELSQASGAQVLLDGPIALRFLPTPRFSAENLDLSGDFGHIRAKRAVFALALPGLLQGRLQFTRARLDDADVLVDADRARRPNLTAAVQFDDLTLRGARLAIRRGGAAALALEKLDLAARIPGPQGPFEGHGAFDATGRRVAFNFATDVLSKDILPLKADLTWPDEMARIDLDGRLDLSKAPAFEGEAKAVGKAAPGPWTAQASVRIWLDGALARGLEARLGDGPLAGRISGSLGYAASSGKRTLLLHASALSREWAGFFAPLLLDRSRSSAPLELRLGADELNWRGVSLAQAQLIWPPGGPAQVQATGPGETFIELSATPGDVGWRGKTRLKATDFAAFATALREAAPPALGAALSGAGLHRLEADGDFVAKPNEWTLANSHFRFDGARLSGDVTLKNDEGRAPLLSARLSASELDLDAAPDLAASPGLDLDLSLDAQNVKSARAGPLSGPGGRIELHLLRAGEAVRLERLDLRNIGGADLAASASWGKDFSGLRGEAKLKAGNLSPLAQALARLMPGALSRALAARANSLSPADLVGKAADGGLSVNGSLGATKVAVSLPPEAGGKRAIAVDLSAPEAGPLLNQLGAQVVWTQKLGPARLAARTQSDQGRPGAEAFTASAEIAGLHGEFHGAMADSALDGDVALSGDAGKILGLYAHSQPPAPLRFNARASWRDGVLSLSNLAGDWAGDKIAGDLSVDSDGVKGALRCDRLSATALIALVLGPPAPVKSGALWPSLSFAPTMFDPPPVKLAIDTKDLAPLGAKSRFDLSLGPGALSVARFEAETLGGTLRGGIDLRRAAGQATVTGDAQAENIAVQNPALAVRLDGRLTFAGGGASVAALVGSLAGEGAVRLRDLVVQGAAEAGPDEALAASEASAAPFDAKEAAKNIDAAFARDVLRRQGGDFTVRLAGGQLALSPADESARGLEVGFDLRDATFSLRATVAARNLPAGWNAPAPAGAAVWSGSWRTPTRRIESTGFVNAVAIRALEREQARIEKQKEEDRERLRQLAAPPSSLQP